MALSQESIETDIEVLNMIRRYIFKTTNFGMEEILMMAVKVVRETGQASSVYRCVILVGEDWDYSKFAGKARVERYSPTKTLFRKAWGRVMDLFHLY